jgi:hypothetical protein
MIFLLNFRQEVLRGFFHKSERRNYFVQFANRIKESIKNPIDVARVLNNSKNELVSKLIS